jgi:hypothetical protein
MKKPSSFSGRFKVIFAFAIAFALLVAGVLLYLTEFKVREAGTFPEITVQPPITDYPEPYLKTKPAAKYVRDHMLDGDFKIVTQVNIIPEAWRSIFDSSFVEIDGSPAKRTRVELADPGMPIQEGDSVVPGLPFRRLILAGFGAQRGFIYYLHGGGVPHYSCLAVMDGESRRMLWVGRSRKIVRSLEDLRLMVWHGLFDDEGKQGC